MTVLSLVFRFALALVFVVAGIAKLSRRDEFSAAVEGYRLVPLTVSRIAARAIPPAELLIGLLLAGGLGIRAVSSLAAAVLFVFTGAVAINLARGRHISCGCAGIAAAERIGWPTVVRNAVLIGMAVTTAVVAPVSAGLDAVVQPGAGARVDASSAIAAIFVALLGTVTVALVQQATALARAVQNAPEQT
jgi:uncharacterized membrane protein YphA (DoxX/SURF4 family)